MSRPHDECRLTAAELAHDANNMLGVVVACANALLSRAELSSDAVSVLLQLRAATTRATGLVRQLVSAQPNGAHHESVVVDAMLVGIEGMLRVLAGPQVDLVITRGAHGASVLAEPGRLEDLVLNLVCNACDAMSRVGRLEIATEDLDLANGPHVMLAVSDTGTGIDEPTRRRMFEPFFTTKKPGRGAGLGLTIALKTVEEAGGTIEVETMPGAGTTMRVYLPRNP